MDSLRSSNKLVQHDWSLFSTPSVREMEEVTKTVLNAVTGLLHYPIEHYIVIHHPFRFDLLSAPFLVPPR